MRKKDLHQRSDAPTNQPFPGRLASEKKNRLLFVSFLAIGTFFALTAHPKGRLERTSPARTHKLGVVTLWPQYVKMDSWAVKFPVPRSQTIVDIGFTGRYATYEHADTWYPSWASDGNMYSPWTDGRVGSEECSSGGKGARTGQAKIEGDDPLRLTITSLGTFAGDPSPYEGRYPCGSLVFNGVWYYGTYCLLDHPGWSMNWPILGPFVGFRTSEDYGKTWEPPALTPPNPLFGEKTSVWGAEPVKMGSPHFVDFGKNMEHSPDGRSYLVGHGATAPDPLPRAGNLSWISGDEIYLARVRPSPETMNDAKSYEFYAGDGPDGRPIWTSDFSKIVPIFSWNNHCGCVTMTYDAPLHKYLMWITDGWPTIKSMDTYILESSEITGPWKMVTYWKDFGPQAYFVNMPSKFMSADGRTAWLSYSANFTYGQDDPAYAGNPPGSTYQWCLHEVRLLDRAEYDRVVKAGAGK
jgi:hypothetical protein